MRNALAIALGVALAGIPATAFASRDSSGTYTLSPSSPFVTGTPISSSTMNTRFSDIATALTDSLSRSGSGVMLAPLKLYSGGNATAPEIAWNDDANSGLYLIGDDNVGLSLGGTKRWDFGAAGSTLTGALTVSGAFSVGGASLAAAATTATNGGVRLAGTPGSAANPIVPVVDASDDVNVATRKIVNVENPTAAQDAATKAYVDQFAYTIAVKTSADTVVTATPVDITEIAFPVEANGIYHAEVLVHAVGSGGTFPGFKWTGPAAPTSVVMSLEGYGVGSDAVATAFGTTQAGTLIAAGWYSLRVLLVNGANAGTVQLQYYAAGAGSATLKKGAVLRYRKIG